MENGQEVKVYTDDIMGWEDAILVERYSVLRKGSIERWGIETESGAFLVRYIKDSSNKLQKDGCGYINAEEVQKCM